MSVKRTKNLVANIRLFSPALILLVVPFAWCVDGNDEISYRACIVTYPVAAQPDGDLERILVDALTLELVAAEYEVAGVVLDARKNLFMLDGSLIPEVEWSDVLLSAEYTRGEQSIEVRLLIIDPLRGEVLAEAPRSAASDLFLDQDVVAVLREAVSLLDREMKVIALDVRERRTKLAGVDVTQELGSAEAADLWRRPTGPDTADVAAGAEEDSPTGDALPVGDSILPSSDLGEEADADDTEVFTGAFELRVGLSPHIVVDGGERGLGRGLSADIIIRYALQQQRYQWIFGAHAGLSWLRSWEDREPVEGYVFPLMVISGVGSRGPGVFQVSFTAAAGPAIGLFSDPLSGMQLSVAIAGRAGLGLEIHLLDDFHAELRAAAYVLQEGAGTYWGFMPSLLFAFSPRASR